jgi:hypothetical protein
MSETERLRSIDTVWLDAERPGPSNDLGSIYELDGPAPSIDEVRDSIASRLHLIPGRNSSSPRPASGSSDRHGRPAPRT